MPSKHKNNIQSIIFDRRIWTESEANDWILKHRYKIKFGNKKGAHITDRFIRYRQKSPKKGYKYRIYPFGHGIEVILSF